MADTDPIRSELDAIADVARDLPARRHAAVLAARDAGVTWREIAERLEMTEEGVRKAMRREAPMS